MSLPNFVVRYIKLAYAGLSKIYFSVPEIYSLVADHSALENLK